MDSYVYANVTAVEAAVSGSATLNFVWKSRSILIMNDSSTVDIDVYINGGGPLSLLALETMTGPIWTRSIRVSAPSSANVRAWAYG